MKNVIITEVGLNGILESKALEGAGICPRIGIGVFLNIHVNGFHFSFPFFFLSMQLNRGKLGTSF